MVQAALGASNGNCREDAKAAWLPVEGFDVESRVALEEQLARPAALPGALFTDPDFPPDPRSIDGRGDRRVNPADVFAHTMASSATEAEPLCRCGNPCSRRTVRKGPAKGRTVLGCASGDCKFSEFADAGPGWEALGLSWKRLRAPEYVVVGDQGIRAADVRQGGVGDCWFISALAVVAAAPSLVNRVLPQTAPSAAGCYGVRLFFDGVWTSVLVDDFFPVCVEKEQRRADGTGVAYARGAQKQLWVSLVEKAYAKSHGCYTAISGGEVSEALLDLTGLPTAQVDFADAFTSPEKLWARLVGYADRGCPMGCGTAKLTLEEMGLVGQHAYSLVALREFESDGGPPVRMVRLRNPWGEWARREFQDLAALLDAPPVEIAEEEGYFWLTFTDFLRGFGGVDVCLMPDAAHAASFAAELAPGAPTGFRGAFELEAAGEVGLLLVQPTARGAGARRARVELADLHLLVLDAASGALVASAFGGTARAVHLVQELPPGRYTVVPLSLHPRRCARTVVRVVSMAPAKCRRLSGPPAGWLPALHRALLTNEDLHRVPRGDDLLEVSAGSVVVVLGRGRGAAGAALELRLKTKGMAVLSSGRTVPATKEAKDARVGGTVPPEGLQAVLAAAVADQRAGFSFGFEGAATARAGASAAKANPPVAGLFAAVPEVPGFEASPEEPLPWELALFGVDLAGVTVPDDGTCRGCGTLTEDRAGLDCDCLCVPCARAAALNALLDGAAAVACPACRAAWSPPLVAALVDAALA